MSGKRFVSQIQQEQQLVESKVRELAQEISVVNQKVRSCDLTVSDVKKVLVAERLRALMEGEVESISGTDAQVSALIKKQAEKIGTIELKISSVREQKAQLLEQLDGHIEQLAQYKKLVQQRAEEHKQKVMQQEHWQQLHNVWEQVHAIDVHASKKAQDSIEQMQIKRKEYESDVIFMYLWERKQSNTLGSGWLDHWCAKVVDFQTASKNYGLLLELPVRLKEHADAMARQAQYHLEQKQQYEKQVDTGVDVQGAKSLRERAEEEKQQKQQELKNIEQQLEQLLQEQQRLSSGTDADTQKAYELLYAPMESNDWLRIVGRWVKESKSKKDDDALVVLQQARKQRTQWQEQLEQLRQEHGVQKSRMDRIERLIKEFRRRDFDASNSKIKGIDSTDFLAWYMLNDVSISAALGRIDRHQTFERSQESSYSSASTWPSSSSSSSSSSGTFGGGGFSSGDSFGGSDGGFSSGDSF